MTNRQIALLASILVAAVRAIHYSDYPLLDGILATAKAFHDWLEDKP